MVNFASFKYLPICIYDLFFLYINIIINNISNIYLYLEILRIENINIIEFVIIKKFKGKID